MLSSQSTTPFAGKIYKTQALYGTIKYEYRTVLFSASATAQLSCAVQVIQIGSESGIRSADSAKHLLE